MTARRLAWSLSLCAVVGCGAANPPMKAPAPSAVVEGDPKEAAEIAAERAKLSVEDKALVEAQEWCVVANDERLGAMGAPIKLMVKDTPVFICCKGCEKKALANPDKTLAKLTELKEKAKAEK